MKKAIFICLLIGFGLSCCSQKLHVTIYGTSEKENKIIDSIGYKPYHSNAKSILEEVNLFSKKTMELGFLENEAFEIKKTSDSTFISEINLGNKTEFIHIYVGTNATIKTSCASVIKKDTVTIPLQETEAFLKQTLQSLEKKGFAMSLLKLDKIKKTKGYLVGNLVFTIEKARKVNEIVIKGYDQFPKGHLKVVLRNFKNAVFNQNVVQQIHTSFEKFRFVKQIKYPEILFETDSTKIYVYLEKTKSNSFDGFIGFATDEKNKLQFNGYLDLSLQNSLHSGEQFSLFWKSAASLQKTFNVALEVPYLFKSPIGIKTQLNIFKQDSTFQNTKTAIEIGYYFNYNTRLYLGYQATESSDIQNQNTTKISDFKNNFLTSNFEFLTYDATNLLFPEKTKLAFKIGIGSRNSNFESNKQLFTILDFKHCFHLNNKNNIAIKSQNFYLLSDHYIVNELSRFGGINSIRGFSENSLQSNLFISLLTEYRYVFSPSLYLHSILDYGFFQDATTKNNGKLLGVGLGLGLLTKNGLLNIVYANGSFDNQAIVFSNSLVQISFKSNF